MGFDLMQGVGLVIRELITQDHSLFDPRGDRGREDVFVETFLKGNEN